MKFHKHVWMKALPVGAAILASALLLKQMHGQEVRLIRNCGSSIRYDLLTNDPAFNLRMAAVKDESQRLFGLWESGAEAIPRTLPAIPVVVHVVYKAPSEKISEEQVKSEIEVLNRDYGRVNPVASKVPPGFQPLVGNPGISFQLASRDPDGKKTNGIIYTATTNDAFTDGDGDSVKSLAKGGDRPWPRDSYLNIWICNLKRKDNGEPLLGYSSWPAEKAEVDGVVILYQVFGTKGVPKSDYTGGRTATHEIGHWLGLHHLWGDKDPNKNCSNDDDVADTPIQFGPNYQCRVYPSISCKNGPKGDMFMNFMDYSPDSCMLMFTEKQVLKMQVTLNTLRASLKNSKGTS